MCGGERLPVSTPHSAKVTAQKRGSRCSTVLPEVVTAPSGCICDVWRQNWLIQIHGLHHRQCKHRPFSCTLLSGTLLYLMLHSEVSVKKDLYRIFTRVSSGSQLPIQNIFQERFSVLLKCFQKALPWKDTVSKSLICDYILCFILLLFLFNCPFGSAVKLGYIKIMWLIDWLIVQWQHWNSFSRAAVNICFHWRYDWMSSDWIAPSRQLSKQCGVFWLNTPLLLRFMEDFSSYLQWSGLLLLVMLQSAGVFSR